jgi:hypothetical protein
MICSNAHTRSVLFFLNRCSYIFFKAIHNAEDEETREIEAETGSEQQYGYGATIKGVSGIFGGAHFEIL